jgi:hypothetical protein
MTKQQTIDQLIIEIFEDDRYGDRTVLDEILQSVSMDVLTNSLREKI